MRAAGIAIRSMYVRLQVKDVVGGLSHKPESMPLICLTFFQHGVLALTSQGLVLNTVTSGILHTSGILEWLYQILSCRGSPNYLMAPTKGLKWLRMMKAIVLWIKQLTQGRSLIIPVRKRSCSHLTLKDWSLCLKKGNIL